MLVELTITDFAIIDKLHLTLDPGLHVLTGETGAGKSIIIDAVSLILGGRATADVVRTGAEQAYVEAIFSPDTAARSRLRSVMADLAWVDEEESLILSREVTLRGRHTCRVNGRAVPLRTLQEIGEPLVDIHGQTEHLSLLRVRNHLDLLDRYAGTLSLRDEFAEQVRRLHTIRQTLRELQRDERELARLVDRLEYQIAEIEEAQLDPNEEEALLRERRRLENAGRLTELATRAYNALRNHTEGEAALLDQLGDMLRALTSLEKLEPELLPQRETTEQAFYLLEDVADALRSFRDEIEFNPARLGQVEDRLDLLFQLKRKYGDTIPEILAFAARATQELESISHSEEHIEALRGEEAQLLQEIGSAGIALSKARQEVTTQLAASVERELADLGMPQTRFLVQITQDEAEDGAPADDNRYAFDATGLDKVEFLIAPNPGEPPKPLIKIASGGETSRLMLALKTVLSQADETPTLIFDEIDQGIGGRIGGTVGRKLCSLARHHQVLCITHLPQIAVYSDAHTQTSKVVVEGRTITRVTRLDRADRLNELTQMLGATGEAGRESAREMLQAVADWKREHSDE